MASGTIGIGPELIFHHSSQVDSTVTVPGADGKCLIPSSIFPAKLPRNFRAIPREIRESFARVSLEFRESFAGVSREFRGSFAEVSREFRESFAGVSREFREHLKDHELVPR
jgi:hypothetical protein